jgi:hypothetical protein
MRRLLALSLIVSFVCPAALLAAKPKKKKAGPPEAVVAIAEDEREAVRLYFVEKHGRGKCPPGLAKKNNGCLPPGQAKRRYRVGQRLPPAVAFAEPPGELTVKLQPCPPGYRYVVVDGDLLKLAVGTMLVVDAIEGLVH